MGPTESEFYDKVKIELIEALRKRNAGDFEKAEENYINAALMLLSKASTENRTRRSRNIQRAVYLLDSLLENFHTQNRKFIVRDEREGWSILKELGIGESRVSKISLDEVAGMKNVKKEILERLIYPIRYRELSQKYGIKATGGALLFGPPGTGKTMLARAVANEAGATFINISPSKLYSQWFGQFERNISKVFEAAINLSPSVIFFDEIDTLTPKRGAEKEDAAARRGVSQFLLEIEGVEKHTKDEIFLLAATNRPWDVDEAMLRPGRFDVQIYTSLPDSEARKKLFELNLGVRKFYEKTDYNKFATATLGYSGADISYICRRAAIKTFTASVEKGIELEITRECINETIKEVNPSVSKSTIKLYEEFSASKAALRRATF